MKLTSDPTSRRWALKYFLQSLLSPTSISSDPAAPSILLRLPLSAAPNANLAPLADTILLEVARNPPSSSSSSFSAYLETETFNTSIPSNNENRWWKILYSFRVSRSDFRGAAEALWEWLHRLRVSSQSAGVGDPDTAEIDRVFLLLINVLASVDPEQAWLLAEAPGPKTRGAAGRGSVGTGVGLGMRGKKERKIVTLEDVRKDYSAYLDQLAAVEQGRFAFVERDAEGDVSML